MNVLPGVVKKSQIEGGKHQDDSDVHHQPFPEMVPENQGIYNHDDGYHRHGHHRFCHCDPAVPRALLNYTVQVCVAWVRVILRGERDHHRPRQNMRTTTTIATLAASQLEQSPVGSVSGKDEPIQFNS